MTIKERYKQAAFTAAEDVYQGYVVGLHERSAYDCITESHASLAAEHEALVEAVNLGLHALTLSDVCQDEIDDAMAKMRAALPAPPATPRATEDKETTK